MTEVVGLTTEVVSTRDKSSKITCFANALVLRSLLRTQGRPASSSSMSGAAHGLFHPVIRHSTSLLRICARGKSGPTWKGKSISGSIVSTSKTSYAQYKVSGWPMVARGRPRVMSTNVYRGFPKPPSFFFLSDSTKELQQPLIPRAHRKSRLAVRTAPSPPC